jgi:hypothetical protein
MELKPMAAEEREITIEIICTDLPGRQWGGHGPVHLGIQKADALLDAAPADLKRIVFRPVLRVRLHADGSPNFLGPFAHGPRTGRFIYLIWAIVREDIPAPWLGRIKLLLNHIEWPHVEKAITRKKPIKVTVALTNAKGQPVFASVRADTAKWEL